MNKAMNIFATILPLFLTIGLGMLCRKKRFLTREGVDAVKWVAVNIALPAVSLKAFAQADYSPRNLWIPAWIFVCCILMLALGFAAKRFLRLPGKLSPFLCTGFEGGMLGFALYPMLGGALAPFAIVDMGHVLFVFTVYKVLLSGARGGRALAREAAASPSLWALLAGALLGATGLYAAMEPSGLRGLFDDTLSFVSAPTSFLVLLTIGYDLDFAAIQWRKIAAVVLCRVAVCALMLGCTLLVNRYALGGAMETNAVILLFILPAPFVVTVFSDEKEERASLSSALSVMTCLTVVLFSVMVAIVK